MAWIETKYVGVDGEATAYSANITETYDVVFSGHTATLIDALNATGVPAIWAPYTDEYGTRAIYCMKRKGRLAKEDASANYRIFRVTCEYATIDPSERQLFKPVTATAKWNVQVSINSQLQEEEATSDKDGNVIVNCLDEPIDPPLKDIYYDTLITITYQTDAPDLGTLDACKGKINSGSHTMHINAVSNTFAAGKLLLREYSVSASYTDLTSVATCNVTLNLVYNADGWNPTYVPNRSFYYWDSGTSMLLPITDGNGQAVSQPRYLSADGETVLNSGDDVTYQSYNMYTSTSFTTLLSEIP